jgi:PST family polysaccharide transporter
MGLFVFAPLSYFWGIPGGLTATIIVIIVSSSITALVLKRKSRHVKLSEFIGPFDRAEFGKILKFYPMLIVNGFLPPLVLIMVRDTLTANLSLHSAGLWQATWRLSEAYQAIIISSVALYFMPSLGERAGKPFELKAQITKTFLTVTAVTAVFALSIFVLREQIVHIIFGKGFSEVSGLMPLQLLGDVLKMGGWILGMALVGTVRTHWFIFATALTSAAFVGITKFLVPSIGIHGALEAYVWSGIVQIAVGAFALRDILLLQPRPAANT